METFKEFLIREAGKTSGGATSGRTAAFVRGSQPYAPYNQTPPLSAGRSNSQYYHDLEQWKQNVYAHVVSLIEAGNDVEINGKRYLKQTDFARYHKAALELLYEEGIFVKGGDHPEQIVGVNIDNLSAVRYEEGQSPGSSGLTPQELSIVEWLWEEYQERRLINKSTDHNWSRHTNFVQETVLNNNLQQAGITDPTNLYAMEILTHKDVLNFYQVNPEKLYGVLNKHYYKGIAGGLVSQAIDSAFQGSFKSSNAMTQTVR